MENNKEAGMNEKRRFLRLNSTVEIQYTILGKELQEDVKTKTKNISAGGLCIIAHESLEKDYILGISIYLPGEALPITAKGRVVWIKPFQIGKEEQHYDVGVEFTEIDTEDRKKIDQFVFSFKKV